ncbi:hypothetical protein FA95DRAFT_1683237 [Auriscalpium vulgare]|uniref:Uncharacterized protein n=1 Tax=Auriscalpium vulgare TaxID=40419 RepID=A0ACB8RBG0_9AGAM|nr:hypothetical protein FA95DRAFT_1683237 [Auriscalpium vulgare]
MVEHQDDGKIYEHSPAKRVKTDVSDVSGTIEGGLSELPGMPLDVLFEIFGQLDPADLVRLARVTKAFRRILLSRQHASSLWEQSFQLLEDVPRCPGDMSAPSWAHLLFGGPICQVCGADGVDKVTWVFHLRACKQCLADSLVEYSYARTRCTRYDMNFCQSLPRVVGRYGKVRKAKKYLLKSDVNTMAAELDALTASPNMAMLDALKRDLTTYNEQRMAAANVREHHASVCKVYEMHLEACARGERVHAVTHRLMELGHDEHDVHAVYYHPDVYISEPLTDQAWNRMRPELEALTIDAREEHWDSAVDEAQFASENPKVEFMESIPSKMHSYIPSDVFDHVGDTSDMQPEDREEVAGILSNMRPELMRGIHRRLTALIALIPASGIDMPGLDALEEDNFYVGVAGGLGLATTWFICSSGDSSCTGLFSGFDMLAHYCRATADYSDTAARTTASVMQLVGKDPTTTTAYDLDRVDAPLFCTECNGPDVRVKTVVDWRGAASTQAFARRPKLTPSQVEHALAAHHNDERTPTWALVPAEMKCSRLAGYDSGNEWRWGCGHCTIHAFPGDWLNSKWLRKRDVITHLKDRHAVDEPKIWVDYIYNNRGGPQPPVSTFWEPAERPEGAVVNSPSL